MSSYPLGALGASLACPGCLCRDRVRRYPSDLSDVEWAVRRRQAEQVMAEIRRATGRPMVHALRAMVDAIGYVARNGIEWRALPIDFLSVTWNLSFDRLRAHRLSVSTLSPPWWTCWRSGPSLAGMRLPHSGCRSGLIWAGRRGRSTRTLAAWPSTWSSANGMGLILCRRTGRRSLCSLRI